MVASGRLGDRLPPGGLPVAPATSPEAAGDKAAPRLVLVAEDDAHVRRLIALGLRRAGYDVAEATDGEEALARVAEVLPDVIVSDIMMPGMDGLTMLRRLRADVRTCAVPVILLTANGATNDLVTGLDLGADDYVAKPFNMPELVARVRTKIDRPPVPNEFLPHDRQTGVLGERRFAEEVAREVARVGRGGAGGCLAYVGLDELSRVRERLGTRAAAQVE